MHNDLYISSSTILSAGRGVFAGKTYKKGDLIERCPVIVFTKQTVKYIDKTELSRYYYEWGNDYTKGAIALGFGSIYNHSFASNAKFEQDFVSNVVNIIAITTIPKDTEITTNYNGDPKDHTPLWKGALL